MPPASLLRVLHSVSAFLPRPARRALSAAAAPPPAALDSAVYVYGALSGTTVGLCLWQLHRYGWKLSILEERRALLQSPSVDISRGPLPASLPAMRPVHLQGAVLEACPGPQLQLSPRSPPEGLPQHLERQTVAHSGRQVVAPLRRADGTRVLAVLGWVPSDAPLPSPARLPTGAAPGGGQLSGVLRRTVEPSVWGVAGTNASSAPPAAAGAAAEGEAGSSSSSSASQGVYPFLNTAALAEACGLSAARGDVVDAVLEVIVPFAEPPPRAQAQAGGAAPQSAAAAAALPPWPVTRQLAQLETASLAPPYTHLIYAATWGTLAIFGGLATLRRARGGLGRGSGVRRLAKA